MCTRACVCVCEHVYVCMRVCARACARVCGHVCVCWHRRVPSLARSSERRPGCSRTPAALPSPATVRARHPLRGVTAARTGKGRRWAALAERPPSLSWARLCPSPTCVTRSCVLTPTREPAPPLPAAVPTATTPSCCSALTDVRLALVPGYPFSLSSLFAFLLVSLILTRDVFSVDFFLERVKREWDRERSIDVRDTWIGCLLQVP